MEETIGNLRVKRQVTRSSSLEGRFHGFLTHHHTFKMLHLFFVITCEPSFSWGFGDNWLSLAEEAPPFITMHFSCDVWRLMQLIHFIEEAALSVAHTFHATLIRAEGCPTVRTPTTKATEQTDYGFVVQTKSKSYVQSILNFCTNSRFRPRWKPV